MQGLRNVLGYTENIEQKKTHSDFLKTYTPPKGVQPLTLEEKDKKYREVMKNKHD